jgi:hypothetical protein
MISLGLLTLSTNSEIFRQGEVVRTKSYEQSLYLVRDSITTSYTTGEAINQILNSAVLGNQNLLACLQGPSDCKIFAGLSSTDPKTQLVVLSATGNIVNDPRLQASGEQYGISSQFFNCSGGILCPSFEIQRGICNQFKSGGCTAQFNTYFVPICPPGPTCLQPPIRLKADLVFSTGSSWLLNSTRFYVDVNLGP